MTNEHGGWVQARRRLRMGTEVRAWSRDHDYTGTTFAIYNNTASALVITSPTISKPRSIRKAEFLRIAALWDAYRAGRVDRAMTGTLSQNTSYIFGMLKWLADQEEV